MKFLNSNGQPTGEILDGYFWEQTKGSNHTICFPGNKTYKGAIRNGLFHGKGHLTLENGAIYEGNFIDGLYQG